MKMREARGGAKMTFGGKKIVPDWGKCIVELGALT